MTRCEYCGERLYFGYFHRMSLIVGLVTGLLTMVICFVVQLALGLWGS